MVLVKRVRESRLQRVHRSGIAILSKIDNMVFWPSGIMLSSGHAYYRGKARLSPAVEDVRSGMRGSKVCCSNAGADEGAGGHSNFSRIGREKVSTQVKRAILPPFTLHDNDPQFRQGCSLASCCVCSSVCFAGEGLPGVFDPAPLDSRVQRLDVRVEWSACEKFNCKRQILCSACVRGPNKSMFIGSVGEENYQRRTEYRKKNGSWEITHSD
jgi:hypothetical protein